VPPRAREIERDKGRETVGDWMKEEGEQKRDAGDDIRKLFVFTQGMDLALRVDTPYVKRIHMV
jgi:hypothetical protein